jgi:hypothetical protein
MGVSGATVRRWEAGQSNPSDEDLSRFAEVCHLSPQQREFVTRLYSRPSPIVSGEPANFRQQVSDALSIGEPACLMDELFFIRAWNAAFVDLTGNLEAELPRGLNGIRLALEVGKRPEPAVEWARVRDIVRQMWMWTAHVAVAPAYAALVADLLKDENFAEHWQGLVEGENGQPGPMRMPVPSGESDEGPYTIQLGEMLFPPLYRIFICQPGFEDERREFRNRKPEVFFANRLHWSH